MFDGQAEHEAGGRALGGECQHALRVGGEALARDGLDTGGELAVGVADRDANRLGAEVEADQTTARAKLRGDLDKRADRHRQPAPSGLSGLSERTSTP